ncbi:MAG: hypothetical protein JNK64_08820, partial [Myxococcales bacterium]|nr:hypothetical protein [Myxococcales bacterium]
MLAEKCPNCGAFLPVRRPGVAIRTCEFCELEVPGGVVEVEALTGPSSTWLPPHPPIRRVEPSPAAPPSARRLAIALVVSVVAVLGVVAVVIASARPSARAPAPPVAAPPAVAVAAAAPPPEPP